MLFHSAPCNYNCRAAYPETLFESSSLGLRSLALSHPPKSWLQSSRAHHRRYPRHPWTLAGMEVGDCIAQGYKDFRASDLSVQGLVAERITDECSPQD